MDRRESNAAVLNKRILKELIQNEVVPVIREINHDDALMKDYQLNLGKEFKNMEIAVSRCASEVTCLRKNVVSIVEKYYSQANGTEKPELPKPTEPYIMYEPRSKWIYVSGFTESISANDFKMMLKRKWAHAQFEIYKLDHEVDYPYASFKIGTDDLSFYDLLKLRNWPCVLKVNEYYPSLEDLQGMITRHSDYSGAHSLYPPNPGYLPAMGPMQQFYDAKGRCIYLNTFDEVPVSQGGENVDEQSDFSDISEEDDMDEQSKETDVSDDNMGKHPKQADVPDEENINKQPQQDVLEECNVDEIPKPVDVPE